MPNQARRHHILPKYLIRNYTDKEGNVWVHDTEKSESYKTDPVNVACIKDFYTVDTVENDNSDCIEQDYLSKGETLSKPIIESIVRRKTLPNNEEWNEFSAFIALMYVRGKWFRNVISKVYEKEVPRIVKDVETSEEDFEKALKEIEEKENIKYDLTYEDYILFEKSGQYEVKVEIPNGYYVRQMLESVISLAPVFKRMTPNIISASPTHSGRFVTSDWPFGPNLPDVISNTSDQKGIFHPDMQLYMPLSPWTCLMMNYREYPQCSRANAKDVAFINNLVALNCVRQIISKGENFCWLKRDLSICWDINDFFKMYSSEHKNNK